jgi:hypothetical protein
METISKAEKAAKTAKTAPKCQSFWLLRYGVYKKPL